MFVLSADLAGSLRAASPVSSFRSSGRFSRPSACGVPRETSRNSRSSRGLGFSGCSEEPLYCVIQVVYVPVSHSGRGYLGNWGISGGLAVRIYTSAAAPAARNAHEAAVAAGSIFPLLIMFLMVCSDSWIVLPGKFCPAILGQDHGVWGLCTKNVFNSNFSCKFGFYSFSWILSIASGAGEVAGLIFWELYGKLPKNRSP